MSQGPTIDEVIASYIVTRDQLAAKQKALDEELATMKGFQKAREKFLRSKMEELGVTSLKVAGIGTCFTKTKEAVTVKDWDALLQYVKIHDRYDLIKKGVSKTVVLEMMGEKRDQPLPPGVEFLAFADINIRRP
jgi:hypothetical protein